jgi:hypothetical protein
MPDLGQDLALGDAVALQAVSDQPTWLVVEAGKQALEEPLGCTPIPPVLNQDVQHHAMLVHRSPEVMQHAIDPQKYIIEVSGVARLRPAPPQLRHEPRTELAAPAPDALVRHGNGSVRQD